jgi:hypothetical protein
MAMLMGKTCCIVAQALLVDLIMCKGDAQVL